MALEVKWEKTVCIHSGNCVKTLPAVFKVVDRKFVIEPDRASEEEVRRVVASCPSGALTIAKP
jgi:uncharacterized Fe-S cluster protein YjdI